MDHLHRRVTAVELEVNLSNMNALIGVARAPDLPSIDDVFEVVQLSRLVHIVDLVRVQRRRSSGGGGGRRDGGDEARGGEVRRAHLEIGDGGAQRGRPVDHVLA